MTKLTLSMDEDVIREAKRIARRNHTSVSAMLSRLVRNMAASTKEAGEIPPDSTAARARGFVKLPKGKTWEDVRTEALMEKYEIKR